MINKNRYKQIIEKIFHAHYRSGATEFEFQREEIENWASKLRIKLPKNLGDLIYTFRYRATLPETVSQTAPEGMGWSIQPAGRGQYRFILRPQVETAPRTGFNAIKIPDATPAIINMYALTDEQALLAKVRYNRLIDIFTKVTCYSLQSHLRTFVKGAGQGEIDELYVGVDRRGAHYGFPVQAKGGRDRLHIVQIEQDVAICRQKFPSLVCRPIGAQFTPEGTIALFEFVFINGEIRMDRERHYKLVPADQLSAGDIDHYRNTTDD